MTAQSGPGRPLVTSWMSHGRRRSLNFVSVMQMPAPVSAAALRREIAVSIGDPRGRQATLGRRPEPPAQLSVQLPARRARQLQCRWDRLGERQPMWRQARVLGRRRSGGDIVLRRRQKLLRIRRALSSSSRAAPATRSSGMLISVFGVRLVRPRTRHPRAVRRLARPDPQRQRPEPTRVSQPVTAGAAGTASCIASACCATERVERLRRSTVATASSIGQRRRLLLDGGTPAQRAPAQRHGELERILAERWRRRSRPAALSRRRLPAPGPARSRKRTPASAAAVMEKRPRPNDARTPTQNSTLFRQSSGVVYLLRPNPCRTAASGETAYPLAVRDHLHRLRR